MSDAFPPPPPGSSPAPPPPPTYQQGMPPPPTYQQGMAPPPPMGSPGYMPPAITPTAGGINIGAQIAGAAWPIGIGAIGIVVPIVSALMLGGTIYYFYALPIFGIIYSVRAMTRGFVIGGVVGIVLNVLAGITSLTASGLLNPGG